MDRYGCIVETAHEGSEAIYMVRSSGVAYDVIIADIRLPDFSGYQLLLKLKETLERVPLILMSGFGYDPDHSLVKARQAGLFFLVTPGKYRVKKPRDANFSAQGIIPEGTPLQ